MQGRKRKERGAENPTTPTRVSPRKKAGNQRSKPTETPEELQVTPHKLHRDHLGERATSSVAVTNANVLERGYTSDGMSFDSLVDDDDALPDINMSSPFKCRKYVKDDIVWAPFEEMLWPALVTSVKWPYVRYSFVNEKSKFVHKAHAKKLIPFDNAAKNLELKEQGKAYTDFLAAYELVVKYLCKRKQNADISARRFLTLSDENDEVSQAKDCLFRLTGVWGTDACSSVENYDDGEDDEEAVVDIPAEDDCGNKPCNEEEEEDVGPQESAEERAKVAEILKDLETLPRKMTVSQRQRDKMEVEAKQLLEVIESKECYDYLMQIRNGSIPSSRHKKYFNNELVHGGLGPFTLFKGLTSQLLAVLDNYCDKNEDEHEYKHNVMLAEAIIFAISKVKACSRNCAKDYFSSTSNKVGVRNLPDTQ